MPSVFKLAQAPRAVVVKAIRNGIPACEFSNLATCLQLSQRELASKLGISTRTLTRRTSDKSVLSPQATEKIVRVARVVNKAHLVFRDLSSIAEWLDSPAPALGGDKPIDLLDTDVGGAEVEGLLVGLAHGNFQ